MLKKINILFLSFFYSGFFPFAPGTFASLVFFIIFYWFYPLISELNILTVVTIWLVSFLIISVVSFFGIRYQEKEKKFDHSWIVIDEFLGMMITFIPFLFIKIENDWILLAGLISFRLFDIFKPLGIKKIDSKDTPLAVIFDDFLAGFYALIITFVLCIIYVS